LKNNYKNNNNNDGIYNVSKSIVFEFGAFLLRFFIEKESELQNFIEKSNNENVYKICDG